MIRKILIYGGGIFLMPGTKPFLCTEWRDKAEGKRSFGLPEKENRCLPVLEAEGGKSVFQLFSLQESVGIPACSSVVSVKNKKRIAEIHLSIR